MRHVIFRAVNAGEGLSLALREKGDVIFPVGPGPVPRVGQRQDAILGPLGPTCL